MNLLLQITTHPQLKPHIEHCLAEWLSGVKWTLTRQAVDGRLWLLTLSADPCSDPIQKMVRALMISHWVIGMAFSLRTSSTYKATATWIGGGR